jgi:basic membrane protein A
MLEANETADREPNTIACADGGYDLVVAVGSGQLDIVKNAAAQFPDQKFAITDAILYPTPDNVVSIAFAPNEGQFLVGAAMAMLTTKTDIPGINPDKVVGWISGTENPNINDFWAGFQHGVRYIDPDIQILQAYAGSWGDPIKGKELATAQYELGADVIANVAAGTGLGIFEAAQELQKFVVGVDINQDNIAPGFVLTSMIKHVGDGVYKVIESVVNDQFDGGGYIYMDLASGGIELTDFSTFKEYWGDKFPEDIPAKMEELTAKIASGEIKVDTNPDIRFWEK